MKIFIIDIIINILFYSLGGHSLFLSLALSTADVEDRNIRAVVFIKLSLQTHSYAIV